MIKYSIESEGCAARVAVAVPGGELKPLKESGQPKAPLKKDAA